MAVTDFYAGEIATELLKQLIQTTRKSCLSKERAYQLIRIVEDLQPIIREIQYSGVEIPGHRQTQLDHFSRTLVEGIELSRKVLGTNSWNLYKNLQLTRKMEKLDKKINHFIQAPMPAHTLADVHHMRVETMERLELLETSRLRLEQSLSELGIGNGGWVEEAPRRREETEAESDAFGSGGSGKTTLAKEVAKDDAIRTNFVDNVSSTWELLNSFGPQEGPGGDEDSPFRPSNKEDWSDGDDEKVSKERISPRKDDLDSHLSTSVEDKESTDKDEVGKAPSANISELVCNVSPKGSFRRRITSWQKGEWLGSGSFGTVYEGISDDGFFFAIKEVSLLDQGSQGKQSILQLEQEISLLSQFEHENIVQYLGTYKDDEKLYIFLELMTKGSLATLYHKYNLRDSQVSAYTRQILNGLKYLHDQNVIHRDIKCANILVDASGSVKLADFGLAKATKMNDAKSSKGTAFWMAPEVVNLKNRGYGLAADIWSLGCTVLEMLTRRLPYSPLEGMQALFQIGRGEPPQVPDSLSRDARDLILRCLQVNPNDRPSAAELLDHPFVRKPPTSSGFASLHFDNIWS